MELRGTGDYRWRGRLKQLRAFCYSAELRNMSRAADRMGVGRPAVSQLVRALEEEFETALFERRGPRLVPTPAGDSLYRVALPLVLGIDRIHSAFAEELGQAVAGEIRIGAGLSSNAFILPRYVKAFRDLYPGVAVRVTGGDPRETVGQVRSHEIDFAVGAMGSTPGDLEFHEILSSKMVTITPEGHPLAERERVRPEDIAAWPVVAPPPGTYAREFLDIASGHFGVAPAIAMETGMWGVMKRYVEAGVGIAFVPDISIAPGDRLCMIPFEKRIENYVRSRAYGVIAHRGRSLSRAAQRFIDLMVPGFRGAGDETADAGSRTADAAPCADAGAVGATCAP